jgi:hypothetical protein
MNEQELFSDVLPYVVPARENWIEEKQRKDYRKYGLKISKILFIIAILSFLLAFSWREYRRQEFQSIFDNRIFLAAKAPNLYFARAELAHVHALIWKNHLNEGRTDFFFHSPQNNLQYWFNSITENLQELNETISEDQTKIDQSLALQSLHRSLITTQFGFEKVIKPEGVEHFPYHFASFLWLWISAIAAAIFLTISNFLTPKK